jgi:hypothetical protein
MFLLSGQIPIEPLAVSGRTKTELIFRGKSLNLLYCLKKSYSMSLPMLATTTRGEHSRVMEEMIFTVKISKDGAPILKYQHGQKYQHKTKYDY